jgi:hypothetical protein
MQILRRWLNLPVSARYALPMLLGAGIAVAVGIKWQIVVGVIVVAIWLRVVDAIARARPLLDVESPFPDDRYEKQHPPLPFDTAKIVDAELEEARAIRGPIGKSTSFSSVGLMRSPSKYGAERHEKALGEFAEELTAWLSTYSEAADARYRTFHIPLKVRNLTEASAATDVRLTLSLGDGARFVDSPAVLEQAPERPEYEETPNYLGNLGRSAGHLAGLDLALRRPRIVLPQSTPQWRTSRDHRTATIDVGLVHGNELAELDDDLYIQVRNHGAETVRWTLSATNSTGARSGEFELVCQEPPARGKICRLKGILEYPDVDLKDPDGKVKPARRVNPPPPIQVPDGADRLLALRATAKRNQRESLGITADVE